MNLPEYLCKKIDTWKTHSSEPIPRTRRGFAQRKGARLKWRPWTRWFVPNARARQDGGGHDPSGPGWWTVWVRCMAVKNGGKLLWCKRESEREADIFNISFEYKDQQGCISINNQIEWVPKYQKSNCVSDLASKPCDPILHSLAFRVKHQWPCPKSTFLMW